ncbi:MAG: hypothetical protein U0992_14185 [Planctomycetaceae bacterium]
MDVKELSRLIGAKSGKAEYLPVAFLLKTGYACYGHYNSATNEGMTDLCVLLNVRLLDLSQSKEKARPTVRDFSDFLEDVVVRASKTDAERAEDDDKLAKSKFGKAIPIAAVALNEIAIVYPVAQIGAMLRRARDRGEPASSLLDFEKSEVLQLLRMKLW